MEKYHILVLKVSIVSPIFVKIEETVTFMGLSVAHLTKKLLIEDLHILFQDRCEHFKGHCKNWIKDINLLHINPLV